MDKLADLKTTASNAVSAVSYATSSCIPTTRPKRAATFEIELDGNQKLPFESLSGSSTENLSSSPELPRRPHKVFLGYTPGGVRSSGAVFVDSIRAVPPSESSSARASVSGDHSEEGSDTEPPLPAGQLDTETDSRASHEAQQTGPLSPEERKGTSKPKIIGYRPTERPYMHSGDLGSRLFVDREQWDSINDEEEKSSWLASCLGSRSKASEEDDSRRSEPRV